MDTSTFESTLSNNYDDADATLNLSYSEIRKYYGFCVVLFAVEDVRAVLSMVKRLHYEARYEVVPIANGCVELYVEFVSALARSMVLGSCTTEMDFEIQPYSYYGTFIRTIRRMKAGA